MSTHAVLYAITIVSKATKLQRWIRLTHQKQSRSPRFGYQDALIFLNPPHPREDKLKTSVQKNFPHTIFNRSSLHPSRPRTKGSRILPFSYSCMEGQPLWGPDCTSCLSRRKSGLMQLVGNLYKHVCVRCGSLNQSECTWRLHGAYEAYYGCDEKAGED
jgi:hypothetical protein